MRCPVKIKNPDLKFLLAFKLQEESVLKTEKKNLKMQIV